jgi:hypothetical protein
MMATSLVLVLISVFMLEATSRPLDTEFDGTTILKQEPML